MCFAVLVIFDGMSAARKRARTVSEMISKSQLIYRGSRMRGTLIAVATVAVLAGCSTYDSLTQRFAQSITPYRITVARSWLKRTTLFVTDTLSFAPAQSLDMEACLAV